MAQMSGQGGDRRQGDRREGDRRKSNDEQSVPAEGTGVGTSGGTESDATAKLSPRNNPTAAGR